MKKQKLDFRADELAVPEVITEETKEVVETLVNDEAEEELTFDTLAIPEFHPDKQPKKN